MISPHVKNLKTSPVLVLGNGESRLSFDLKDLHERFFAVGCNAIYRDFSPDILVATDVHITAEIVHSGYTKKNKCYFRDWIPHPAEYKEMLVSAFDVVTDLHTDEPLIIATGLTDVTSDISVVSSEVVVFGVDVDDLSSDLKEIGCDLASKETMEFAGPNALDAATKVFNLASDFFLLGFDFTYHGHEHINNVYAGTANYRPADSVENEKMMQSVYEIRRVVLENPDRHFVLVTDHPLPLPLSGLINFIVMDIKKFEKFSSGWVL